MYPQYHERMVTFKSSSVLITGSSRGIGAATAKAFARQGAKVIITYLDDADPAKAVMHTCKELGSVESTILQLDVRDKQSIERTVKSVVAQFGQLDVLVNNAGVFSEKPLMEQTAEEIKNQIGTNLEGMIMMTKLFLPHVRRSIVNVASGAGMTGYGELTVYCATKFGVRGFTQALGAERPDLRIACVNPGTTATRMSGFQGTPPEKVAEIIVNAAAGVYHIENGGDINVWDHV